MSERVEYAIVDGKGFDVAVRSEESVARERFAFWRDTLPQDGPYRLIKRTTTEIEEAIP